MRHLTSLRVSAVLAAGALLLTGCSGSSGHRPTSGGVVTLNLLTHYGTEPLKSGLQKMVQTWNAANPDIQVKTQAVVFTDLLKTITVQQTGGRSADIIQAYGLWGGQLDKAGVLAPVPGDIATAIKKDYSSAAIGAATVHGQIVGYPTEVQTYALFYNKKLLAEAGYDNAPQTWKEIQDAASKIAHKDAAGNTTVEGFGLIRGYDSEVVHPWLSLMQAAGGQFLSDDGTKVEFDSEAGVEALQFERELIDSGATDLSFDTVAGFSAQQVGMEINAGYLIGALKAAMGDAYKNIGVAPVPGPTAGTKGSLGYGFFMGVTQSSKNQDAAWKFLTWLNAEKGKDGTTPMGAFQYSMGTIPPRPEDSAALADTAADPNLQVFVDALKSAMPEPNPPAAQEIKTELQKSIESVWTGQAKAADVLKTSADFANSKLGNG